MFSNLLRFYGFHYSLKFARLGLYNRHECSKKTLTTLSNTQLQYKQKLVVEPQTCLHDEPAHIKAVGLNPGHEVTLTSTAQDSQQNNYFAYAHYKADSSGIIDLEQHEAIRGSYEGLFSMGLINCLLSSPKDLMRRRFLVNEFSKPLLVKMNLLQGHIGISEAYEPDPQLILDSTIHERVYMAPGSERIPVRYGRIRGTLFLPPGDGPFPGVIDLFGLSGGLLEFRSAQLATRGIASLALAFFRFQDLPESIEFVDMSYFEEAVQFLLGHKKIKKPSIGAIGTSKGGDIACSLGTFIPEVKAVVCVNGLPVNIVWPLKLRDRNIEGLIGDFSLIKTLDSGVVSIIDTMYHSKDHPETWLPLHEADAEFLFVVGKDDQNMRVEKEVSEGIARLKEKGKSNFKVLAYDGAGHLLEPPHSPFCEACFIKIFQVVTLNGGNAKDHSLAQVNAWDEILKFIKKVLA